MKEETEDKENKTNNHEEQKDGESAGQDKKSSMDRRQFVLDAAGSADKKQPKLLTRSGSDPQFDNLEYLAKIENQTLAMLKGQGIDVDLEELRDK